MIVNSKIINLDEIGLGLPKFNSDNIPELNIVIPVYNESKSIIELIKRVHKNLSDKYKYKITVIDDGFLDFGKHINGFLHLSRIAPGHRCRIVDHHHGYRTHQHFRACHRND